MFLKNKDMIIFVLIFIFSTTVQAKKDIVDIHTHIACIDQKNNGCFISEDMINNIRFKYYLKSLGIKQEDIKNRTADKKMILNLVQLIKNSKRLSKAVILAMDGVINTEGNLDKGKTELYIPNKYILEVSQNHTELLYGASINPYRKDALERLEQAYQNGAVLIKWLPNIMHINPSDKSLIPFYKKMKNFGIPLLTHTGFEHSFTRSDNSLGDPALLELPLSLGVKVVAAHFGIGGKNEGDKNFNRILPLFKKYPNLYGDLSGLTLLTKPGAIKKITEYSYLEDRILYGSDYPLLTFPVASPFYHIFHLKLKDIRKLLKIKNRFDRNITLLELLGIPSGSMKYSAKFLNL